MKPTDHIACGFGYIHHDASRRATWLCGFKGGAADKWPRCDTLAECPAKQAVSTAPKRFDFRNCAPCKAKLMPRKIIVHCKKPIGDGIAASRMVEDFHAAFPNWKLDLRVGCRSLFSACPHLTPLADDDPDVEQFEVHQLRARDTNAVRAHYYESWTRDLARQIGFPIPSTGWTPKLYLTKDEMERPADWPKNYWLLSSGWREYSALKRYPHWQEVVDLLHTRLPDVAVIQIGHSRPDHHHAPLNGTISRIGASDVDLRVLLKLAYHADGVLTGVSSAHVLAAALDKPCVIPAGGREPFQLIATPHARFLKTVGQMLCCTPTPCGKQRDGECQLLKDGTSACMEMIRPEEIVREVEKFYEGGRLKLQ